MLPEQSPEKSQQYSIKGSRTVDRYSVKTVPPEVAKQVRKLNDGNTEPKHPYYKIEERSGSGKATCRQCNQMIAEGEPTIFFHYAPDDDNTWIRTKGTIHKEPCESEEEYTKCPKCRKQVPSSTWSNHWQQHRKAAKIAKPVQSVSTIDPLDFLMKGFNWKPMTKTAASSGSEDRARRDKLVGDIPVEDLPSYHDNPTLELSDGYKVVPIKTLGDAAYEGGMMSHCLGNSDIHHMFRSMHGMDDDDWGGHFAFPNPPPVEAIRQQMPEATDEVIEHVTSRGGSRLMSLRDGNDIPRATWWEPKVSAPGTEIREVCGFANNQVKPKYEHRIRQYLRNSLEREGMDTGKLEHVGQATGDNEMAMDYKPIQEIHVHQLPTIDQRYEGQTYDEPISKNAHCGQCPEDREIEGPKFVTPVGVDIPVGEQKKPQTLRDKFMKGLDDVADKVTWAYDPKDKEIDLPLDKKGHLGEDDGKHHLEDFENEFKDSPEVKDNVSEMKGKELAKNLWDSVTNILGESPTHCPNCGTPDTKSHGQKTDEEGWPYEEMGCNHCGKVFGKDEAGSGLDFTTDEPQKYQDASRNKERTAEFKGSCLGCGKRTYAFTDGENDPRGPLGDNAASPLHAEDAYKKGPDVPLCFNCANDYDAYNKASEYGNKIWDRDPDAEAQRDERQRAWEESRKKQGANGLDPMAKPGNDTSMDEDGQANGWKPRVDPATQNKQNTMMKNNLDTQVKKLQKGMKGLDQVAGHVNDDGFEGWKSSITIEAASPFAKEFKKVKQHAEGIGWRVDETNKGWMFKAPQESIQPGYKGIVVTHGSPSDHRAFKNFLGDLKNEGGLIWPPEKAMQRERKQQQQQNNQHDPATCLQAQGVNVVDLSPQDVTELHEMAHEDDARKAGQMKSPNWKNGVMVALYPNSEDAKELALDKEGAEAAGSIHLTLAFVGEKGEDGIPESEGRWGKLSDAVKEVAKRHPPQEAQVTGVGHFIKNDSGIPYVGIMGSHTLHDLHKDLVNTLKGNDLPVSDKYPFVPHLTFAYFEDGDKIPDHLDDRKDLTFSHMVVKNGEHREDFEFGKPPAPKEVEAARKLGMANRSGHPELDKTIEDFLDEPMGDWTTDNDPIRVLSDPQRAHGNCQEVAEQFRDFAKSRGFDKTYATQTDMDEMGYQPTGKPAGYVLDENGKEKKGFYHTHTVNEVHLPDRRSPVTVDFTASQYGYKDHPKVSAKSASLQDDHKPDHEFVANIGEIPYYIAGCSCGWHSNIRSESATNNEWQNHYDKLDVETRKEKAGEPKPTAFDPNKPIPKRHAVNDDDPLGGFLHKWQDGVKPVSYDELPEHAQMAIHTYTHHGATGEQSGFDSPEEADRHMRGYTFGHTEIPTEDLKARLDMEAKEEGADGYFNREPDKNRGPGPGTGNPDPKSRWSVILNTPEERGFDTAIDDGWNRTHHYIHNGDAKIPVVWYAGNRKTPSEGPPTTCHLCKSGWWKQFNDNQNNWEGPIWKDAAWLDQVSAPYQQDAIADEKEDISPVLPPLYEGNYSIWPDEQLEDWKKPIKPALLLNDPKTGGVQKEGVLYIKDFGDSIYHIWPDNKGHHTECGHPMPEEHSGYEISVEKPTHRICPECEDKNMNRVLHDMHEDYREMIEDSRRHVEELNRETELRKSNG